MAFGNYTFIKRPRFREPYIPDMGGNGRYLYRGDDAASTAIDLIDCSLLNAANYVGAGVWTTNPLSTIGTLTSQAHANLCFFPQTQEIISFRQGTATYDVIDVATQTKKSTGNSYPWSLNTKVVLFNPHRDYFIASQANNIYFWKYRRNNLLYTFPIPNNGPDCIYIHPFTGDIIISLLGTTFNNNIVIRDVGYAERPILKTVSGQRNNLNVIGFDLNQPDVIFCSPDANYNSIAALRYSTPYDFKLTDKEILSSISTTVTQGIFTGNLVSSKQKRFYSFNGLLTTAWDISNPLAITSAASHTRTAAGDTRTMAAIINEDYNILCIAGNNTPLHVYDISGGGLSYVGYVVCNGNLTTSLTSGRPLVSNKLFT